MLQQRLTTVSALFSAAVLLCRDVGMNHILDVQVLGDYSNLAVMRAIVGTSKQSLIYKAWPAERAESSLEQLQAEQKAGVLFRSNPTLIPPVAISGNTPSGSFTTVSTFGGCSLKDMMDSNKWWKLPPHDRAVMYKRVGACSFTALETMNEAVSDPCCCCCTAMPAGACAMRCMCANQQCRCTHM
jgi:hypothetical protein